MDVRDGIQGVDEDFRMVFGWIEMHVAYQLPGGGMNVLMHHAKQPDAGDKDERSLGGLEYGYGSCPYESFVLHWMRRRSYVYIAIGRLQMPLRLCDV